MPVKLVRKTSSLLIEVIFILILILINGCSVETPESPRFTTTLNLPLSEEQYTGEDMAQGLEAVEGDSEAPGPLTIRVSEDMEPIYVDDQITLGIASTSYAVELETISFDPPEINDVTLTLGSLLPVPIVSSFPVQVEQFVFSVDPIDLGTFSDFAQVDFLSGEINLSLTNNLPIPVGSPDSGPEELKIKLIDNTSTPATTIAQWQVGRELAPDETWSDSASLAGQTIGNNLVLEITGGSLGSGTSEVELAESQSLGISLAFSSTAVNALTGKLPALAMDTTASLVMDDEIVLEHAVVESGQFSWHLENNLPVTVHVRLEAPQISFGQSFLAREIDLAPGTPVDLVIDLANAEMSPGESEQWNWQISASSEATESFATVEAGQSVSVELNEMELAFASVRGVMDQIEIEFEPVNSEIQFPEGTEGVAFVAAEAVLEITNRSDVTAKADLVMLGQNGSETVSVLFTADIAAGTQEAPVMTRVALNESNSNIVELLSLRPEMISVSGIVTIGDGETTGEVQAGDFIDGSFVLSAPMRLRLENASIDSEPFDVELDDDIRDEMMERLDEFTVQAEVENHFPAGVQVKIHFARSEGALFINDDLVMEAGLILPAEFDPETGRVITPVTSTIEMTVSQGDLDIFLSEQLFGAQEVTLVSDGENPVEIWSTDYVKVRGIASFQVEVK